MSVFRDAITGDDNRVDAGYLALYWSLVGWSISSICLLSMGIYALRKGTAEDVGSVVQNIGVALGAVAGAFATVVGAVGLFRAGDKPHGAPVGTVTTTSAKQETIVTAAPAIPAQAAQAKPVEVSVVEQAKPIEVDMVDKPKRSANAKQTKPRKRRGKTH